VTTPSDSFAEFLAKLKARDGDAARELFRRFTHQLIALARTKFDATVRDKVDPEDVVQSAFKSFFLRYGEGNLELANWNSLWGLLTLITLRKCAERVAYYRAQCRDAAREAAQEPSSSVEAPWKAAVAREPTPLEAVELGELLERLFLELSEDERPILELSLQGYTTQEISEKLGRVERTVRRLRERIRQRLERLRDDSA
jgi:RNA polymerase sigma-70 factor (ECF subfamily)